MISQQQYKSLVYRSYKVLKRTELAEEAVQRVLLKFYEKNNYEPKNLMGYLSFAVRNESLNMRKKDEFRFFYFINEDINSELAELEDN